MNIEILWQIIGFIALFFVFLGFKEKNDTKLILFLTVWSFFWGIHFSMLWLIAAAGINFFDICKNLLWLKFEKNIYLMSFFILSYIIIWYISFLYTQNYFSFLPTLASVISTVWVFIFRGVHLRYCLLVVLWVWFMYNSLWWSIPWITSDIILIWATLYGIYKLKTNRTPKIIVLFQKKKQDFLKKLFI